MTLVLGIFCALRHSPIGLPSTVAEYKYLGRVTFSELHSDLSVLVRGSSALSDLYEGNSDFGWTNIDSLDP